MKRIWVFLLIIGIMIPIYAKTNRQLINDGHVSTDRPNDSPIVSNVTASQRTDGSGMIDIYYDLEDDFSVLLTVELLLSEDGGQNFTYLPDIENLAGDIGEDVPTGLNRHIVWDALSEGVSFDGDNFVVRVLAEDSFIPPETASFAYIQGGVFLMGDTHEVGNDDEIPVHTVQVSPYSIARYPVTNEDIIEVFSWAAQQGYAGYSSTTGTFINIIGDQQTLLNLASNRCPIDWNGSELIFTGSSYAGSITCPCIMISWYGAVAYCNFKSAMDDIEPCYNLTSWDCNWGATGYRLPTEAEHEYAQRGASIAPDYFYSGSDDLNSVGWFEGNSGNGTHPIGLKEPNQLNCYDLTGNVWEWCWDKYSPTYYQECLDQGTVVNPRGPVTGTERVFRGGSWYSIAFQCRISNRVNKLPTETLANCGFRLVRGT